MKQILYTIAAIPALALIGGIGILAWRIGETWTSTTTQSLVTALTVICGGGALLFAILLALLVGIPLAIRAYGEGGSSRRQWVYEGGAGAGWERPKRRALPRFDEDEWVPTSAKRPSVMIEGQWNRVPDAQTSVPPAQSMASSWGVTGGGQTQLLPPVEQDARFGVE